MPYIKQPDREELKTRKPKTAGELNYLITLQMHKYFKDYQTINDIVYTINELSREPGLTYILSYTPFGEQIRDWYLCNVMKNDELPMSQIKGALGCALLEFYRRVGGPYEDQKALENGDV